MPAYHRDLHLPEIQSTIFYDTYTLHNHPVIKIGGPNISNVKYEYKT